MQRNLLGFLTLLLVSSLSFASSKVDREAVLNEIFKGLNGGVEEAVIASYSSQYIDLINDRLDKPTSFTGLNCRAKVSLASSGTVEHVKLSNQNELCRKVFNTVWDIGSFPLPNDVIDANKLRKFHLSINL